jgi:hypothetical protein
MAELERPATINDHPGHGLKLLPAGNPRQRRFRAVVELVALRQVAPRRAAPGSDRKRDVSIAR